MVTFFHIGRARQNLFPQSDRGIRCLQKESSDTTECFSGQQRPRWNFAHVQVGVNQHILQMLENTFSLDAARTSLVKVRSTISAYNFHFVSITFVYEKMS